MSSLPYPDNPGQTHYEGCWRDPHHHNCAVAQVHELVKSVMEGQQLTDKDAEIERLTVENAVMTVCAATLRLALARALDPEAKDPLAAPCIWCGYNGSGYWQRGTHDEGCMWRDVGGEADRLEFLRRGSLDAALGDEK